LVVIADFVARGRGEDAAVPSGDGAHVAAALASLSLDISCVVDHIDLMETFLDPSGARHEVKLQFALGGGGDIA
jgi:hypothetical protein